MLASGGRRSRTDRLVRAALCEAKKHNDRIAGRLQSAAVLNWAIIVKPPISASERGILFVSFEAELAKLLRHKRFGALQEQYQIAFFPTWQPAYSRELFSLAAQSTLPFLVMPAAAEDVNQLPIELGDRCVTLPLHAASWIPAGQFAPSENKDIDIILLANFSKYKRHWKLFEGLSQTRRSYRTVCAGRPWGGRQRHELESEASAFGVKDSIEFMENPTNEQVADLLARSRLFCAMSHKEGSFVAVGEALVAGTPVGMFEDAMIGTKSVVGPETGFLFSSKRPLGPQLDDAVSRSSSLHTREWACREITAERSVKRFNDIMRQHSLRSGTPWTTDISGIFCRNFCFGYQNRSDVDSFRPFYTSLSREYNLEIKLLDSGN
jgi:hypothetical protein